MEETVSSVSPFQNIRALALVNLTRDDYRTTYWPQLQAAVDQLLQGPPSCPQPGPTIEFERMFSAVYKCVCHQHAEALYSDLTTHIHSHFLGVAAQLQDVEEDQLIDRYYYALHHALYSLDGIIPIFTYMNKVYVVTKLLSNLRTELQTLLCTTVIDPVFDKLIGKVKEIMEFKPFSVAPHVLASLVKNLYKLKPAYAERYPQVFASYIPGVLPAMREHELSSYISQTRQLQNALRQAWTPITPPPPQGRKRGLE